MINGFFTLLGSNSVVDLPEDLLLLIKDEVLVDPRDGKPMEMDAPYLYFNLISLEQINQVDYSSEKKKIVDALFAPIIRYGFYKHSHWTEEEIHLRFTSSALFLICYLKNNFNYVNSNVDVEKLLLKHISYGEYLKNGYWFFHDSLENDGAVYPDYIRFKNVFFYSSPFNLLILNTHIDTLLLLVYFKNRISDDNIVNSKLLLGAKTLNQMLDLRIRWIHRVDVLIREQYFRARLKGKESFFYKVLKKYFYTIRYFFKNKYPLFFYADGYSERELGLAGENSLYHVINIWDLCRLLSVCKLTKETSVDEKLCNQKIQMGIEYIIKSKYFSKLVLKESLQLGVKICEILIYAFRTYLFKKDYVTTYILFRENNKKSAAIVNFDPILSLPLNEFELEFVRTAMMENYTDCIKIAEEKFILINYSNEKISLNLNNKISVVWNEFDAIVNDFVLHLEKKSAIVFTIGKQ